ncbi:MAG: Hsp70 family protein [Actinomycetota bacterium]
MADEELTLCLDLGTTRTAAVVVLGERSDVVALGANDLTIPSLVHRDADGDWSFGDEAARRGAVDPNGLAREFKRDVGEDVPVVLNGASITPVDLMGRLLRHVVDVVAEREGRSVDRLVLTHPAPWSSVKRALLAATAREHVRLDPQLIPEPVAVAVHYSSAREIADGETVGVYDFGGGTFDATLVQRRGDNFSIVGEPLGVEDLGGIDLDDAVVELVTEHLPEGSLAGLDRTDERVRRGLERLRRDATDAKEALSNARVTGVQVALPGVDTTVRITREEFEERTEPMLRRTVESMRSAVEGAGLDPSDISALLLAGGSSRTPFIAELLAADFPDQEVDLHPKLAVVQGAAAFVRVGRRARPSLPLPLIGAVVAALVVVVVAVLVLDGDDPADIELVTATTSAPTGTDPPTAGQTTAVEVSPEARVIDLWSGAGGLERELLVVLCAVDYRAVEPDDEAQAAPCRVAAFSDDVLVEVSTCQAIPPDIDRRFADLVADVPTAYRDGELAAALDSFLAAQRTFTDACRELAVPSEVAVDAATTRIWLTYEYDRSVSPPLCAVLAAAGDLNASLADFATGYGCGELDDHRCLREEQLRASDVEASELLDDGAASEACPSS